MQMLSKMTDIQRSFRQVLLGLALSAIAGQTLSQPTGARAVRNGDYIVAVVNSELVTAFEVEQRVNALRAEALRAGTPAPAEGSLRKQVLDALIDERVIVTYARDSSAKVDDAELDRAVANVASQNQMTADQLRERLRVEGTDFARFKGNLRDQMLIERVREREVLGRIRVTDGDIDLLVEKRRADAAGDVELNLAQILISVPEGATAAEIEARRLRAQAALVRLRAGDDFASVAKEMSEDGNRERGGEIGLRPARRLPDLFVEAVRAVKAGEFTVEAVKSGAGFHVLKVLQRSDGKAFQITQTRARHILLRPSERLGAPALVARLTQIRRDIERAERKFEDVARELSEDGTAAAGGDLGWSSPGGFVPEFEDAMNALPLDGMSPPVVTRFGVHLIQVLQRRDVALEPKEVREQARNVLREQKFEQAFAEWTKELRQRAYLEMREPPQ